MRTSLESLGQFRGESALGSVGSGLAVLTGRGMTLKIPVFGFRVGLRLRWLREVGAKQFAFERSAIKPPDDRLHLFLVRCVDKSETLRFLCFGIADHLDRVGDHGFRVK